MLITFAVQIKLARIFQAQRGRFIANVGSGMLYDDLGRALIDATHSYLRARKPTHQLTHALLDTIARLVSDRSGEAVSIKIGNAAVITRKSDKAAA